MQPHTLPDAVLFDMDGLMLDTETLSLEAWRLASADTGLAVGDDVLLGMVGLSIARCRDYLTRHFDGDSARADRLMAGNALHYPRLIGEAPIPLKAGIVELLDALAERNIPRAVATSTRRIMADQKLARTGLAGRFHASVTGDEVTRTKPAPDIYLAAAAALGVDPARCIALEDSNVGVAAALAAGCTVYMVPDLIAHDPAVAGHPHAHFADLHAVRRHLLGA